MSSSSIQPNIIAPRDVNTSAPAPVMGSSGSDAEASALGGAFATTGRGEMGSGSGPGVESGNEAAGVKNMEYHRQVLQNKIANEGHKTAYISPSDTIMSPCTAKLAAKKTKHFMKAKPQTLFAQTSSKNMPSAGSNPFASTLANPSLHDNASGTVPQG